MARICNHEVKDQEKVEDKNSFAQCKICGDYLGWYCPDNTTHLCTYNNISICVHCGKPRVRN